MTVAALAAGAAAARSAPSDPSGSVAEVRDALSAVDFLPSADELSGRLGGDEHLLIELARSDGDPGVQIRATRALGLFPTDAAREALVQLIAAHADATAGTELLLLIAGIEALGPIGGSDSVEPLVPYLAVASRDVRYATARALGETAADAACDPLRARQSLEGIGQVRIAIDDAIARVCR